MKIILSILISIIIISSPLISNKCFSKNKNAIPLDKISKIIYRYYDSSVPPEYHRSYTFIIDKNKINLTVDCYGDILNEKEIIIDTNQFELIKNSLVKNKIRLGIKIESKDCTGGTSEKIEYYSNDKCLFSASVYHCGNKDYGDLRGEINNLAEEIKGLIPNFNELLKRDN
ncbi:MAG: hypothetical protein HZB41_14015 [Ignavibacteriae bacterium]|nr:hypothetical protein [Ignavibacteriota bacterium]